MCTWRGCCIVMGKWRGGGMRVLTMMVLTFVGGEVAGMLCVGGEVVGLSSVGGEVVRLSCVG